MKKTYQTLKLKLLFYDSEDIVTASVQDGVGIQWNSKWNSDWNSDWNPGDITNTMN